MTKNSAAAQATSDDDTNDEAQTTPAPKRKARPPQTPAPKLIMIKVTPKMRRDLQMKAKRYTGGNLSLWLRYAGLAHTPPRSELQQAAKP